MDTKTFSSSLQSALGMSTADVAKLTAELSRAVAQIGEELDSVSIPRFGTFDAVKEDERIDIDISTGSRVLLPPSITLRFIPSAALRKACKRIVEKGGAQ